MLFFVQKGYRVIAHDRRGHGRSTQVGDGQVARYVAKFGEPHGRVAKAVFVSAVPPLMLKTESNPAGLPIGVFDGFRTALADNRAQFYMDVRPVRSTASIGQTHQSIKELSRIGGDKA